MNAHNGKDNGRPPAIVVDKLTKKFGNFTADDALEFTVRQGEIFGILGPNGAGKSTLIRMLNTLLVPTSGRATVMGFDVARETAAVRHEIGVIPQANTVDGDLTAWESMDIYGKFYGMSRRERQQRATQLLEAVGLTEWKDKAAGTFSGGMRRSCSARSTCGATAAAMPRARSITSARLMSRSPVVAVIVVPPAAR